MRCTLLGDSGLRVSRLALGTMTFGTDWGFGGDAAEARAQFDAFAEAGGNFVDTANKYTDGSAERLVGECIAGDRDRFVVGTKYSLSVHAGDPNGGGNSRKSLVRALEESLRRLGTDYVDILWLHAWDYLTPVDEVMRALDDQVRLGKVLYLGISDTPAWIVAQAQTTAQLRGWNPFVALQTQYSLVQRDSDRELLPMAEALGLGVTAWGPLGSGVLSGKYDRRRPRDADPRRLEEVPERSLAIAEDVVDLAAELDVTPSQLSIAWLMHREMIPVLGARTREQFAANLAAAELRLEPGVVDRLDALSRVELGFPHDFLQETDWCNGGLRDAIDVPAARRGRR